MLASAMASRPGVTGQDMLVGPGFATAVTLGTALLFGLAPGLEAARLQVMRTLRETGSVPLRRRLGAALIVGEITVGVVLVIGAGLLIAGAVLIRL